MWDHSIRLKMYVLDEMNTKMVTREKGGESYMKK